jgi:hypothetical protein
MDAIRLESGSRIRPDLVAVQDITIPVPRPNTLHREIEIASFPRLHRNRLTSLIEHVHRDLLRTGSPHAKPDSRRTDAVRTKVQLPLSVAKPIHRVTSFSVCLNEAS